MSTILSEKIVPPKSATSLKDLFRRPQVNVPVNWVALLRNAPASVRTPKILNRIAEAEKALSIGVRVVEQNGLPVLQADRRAAELRYSADPTPKHLDDLTRKTALATPAASEAIQAAGWARVQAEWIAHVPPLIIEIYPELIAFLKSKGEEIAAAAEAQDSTFSLETEGARLPLLAINKAILILQNEMRSAKEWGQGKKPGAFEGDLHCVPSALVALK